MPLNLADYTFKQYPAKEQSELTRCASTYLARGSFNGLAGADRAAMYEAQAYDYEEARTSSRRAAARRRYRRSSFYVRLMSSTTPSTRAF